MQMIVSRQGYAASVGDNAVVDPETHLPYDMSTETVPLGVSGGPAPH